VQRVLREEEEGMSEFELPVSAEDFLDSVVRRMDDLAFDFDFPRKAVVLRLPPGRALNYYGDRVAWCRRRDVDTKTPSITSILEYTSGNRGMNCTARMLYNATTPREVALVFSHAFLHDRLKNLFSEWRGGTFLFLSDIQRILNTLMYTPYHHASRGLLPLSVVEWNTPPPKRDYEVAQLIAIDAALSVGGFRLIRVASEEEEPLLKLAPSEV
jgi:hypothetical protein